MRSSRDNDAQDFLRNCSSHTFYSNMGSWTNVLHNDQHTQEKYFRSFNKNNEQMGAQAHKDAVQVAQGRDSKLLKFAQDNLWCSRGSQELRVLLMHLLPNTRVQGRSISTPLKYTRRSTVKSCFDFSMSDQTLESGPGKPKLQDFKTSEP